MSQKVLYFTRFLPTCELGGGSRRMMQIYETLKVIFPELQVVSSARGDHVPQKERHRIGELSHRYGIRTATKYFGGIHRWSKDHRTMVYRLRQFARIWRSSIHNLQELDGAVLDDPIYFLPLMRKLLRLHIPVIAVCHNIETAASHQVEKRWALELFKEELEILSRCHLVITISREEDVLLNNLHIPSLFFPYYPVKPILERLMMIRNLRAGKSKTGIFMAGTSKNPQTREGMARVASYWHENRLDRGAGRLIIGGYKSETYLDLEPFAESTDFRGTLSNEDHDLLLSEIRAFLCYQERGSGALTRICEMLIAGVPIIANSYAARSYYNMKGLIEFRTLNELEETLAKLDTIENEFPAPPKPETSYLLSRLHI